MDNIWECYIQQRSMVSFHLFTQFVYSEIDDAEQPSEEPTHWVDDLTNDGALLYSDVDDEL